MTEGEDCGLSSLIRDKRLLETHVGLQGLVLLKWLAFWMLFSLSNSVMEP